MTSITFYTILMLDLQVKSSSFADFLIVSELGCGIQRGCMGLGRLYQVSSWPLTFLQIIVRPVQNSFMGFGNLHDLIDIFSRGNMFHLRGPMVCYLRRSACLRRRRRGRQQSRRRRRRRRRRLKPLQLRPQTSTWIEKQKNFALYPVFAFLGFTFRNSLKVHLSAGDCAMNIPPASKTVT